MLVKIHGATQIELQVAVTDLDGTPKTNLSTSNVRVYHIAGGVEVNDLASTPLVQVGSTNIYRYIWSSTPDAGTYFVEYYLVDDNGKISRTVEDMAILDVAKQADLEIIKKVETGRWKIVGNQMIFYDDDDTTPLLTFNLLDSLGAPSSTNVYERTPAP